MQHFEPLSKKKKTAHMHSPVLDDEDMDFDPFNVEGGPISRSLSGIWPKLFKSEDDLNKSTVLAIQENVTRITNSARFKTDPDAVFQAILNSLSHCKIVKDRHAKFRLYSEASIFVDDSGRDKIVALLAVDIKNCNTYVFHNIYFEDSVDLPIKAEAYNDVQQPINTPMHEKVVPLWHNLWVIPLRLGYITAELLSKHTLTTTLAVINKLVDSYAFVDSVAESVILEHLKYRIHHNKILGEDMMETVSMEGHGSGAAYADVIGEENCFSVWMIAFHHEVSSIVYKFNEKNCLISKRTYKPINSQQKKTLSPGWWLSKIGQAQGWVLQELISSSYYKKWVLNIACTLVSTACCLFGALAEGLPTTTPEYQGNTQYLRDLERVRREIVDFVVARMKDVVNSQIPLTFRVVDEGLKHIPSSLGSVIKDFADTLKKIILYNMNLACGSVFVRMSKKLISPELVPCLFAAYKPAVVNETNLVQDILREQMACSKTEMVKQPERHEEYTYRARPNVVPPVEYFSAPTIPQPLYRVRQSPPDEDPPFPPHIPEPSFQPDIPEPDGPPPED